MFQARFALQSGAAAVIIGPLTERRRVDLQTIDIPIVIINAIETARLNIFLSTAKRLNIITRVSLTPIPMSQVMQAATTTTSLDDDDYVRLIVDASVCNHVSFTDIETKYIRYCNICHYWCSASIHSVNCLC
jgi:hypothetical protein